MGIFKTQRPQALESAILLTYFIIAEPSDHSKLLQKVLFPKFFLLFQLKHFARDY